jgi:hypothetical protein
VHCAHQYHTIRQRIITRFAIGVAVEDLLGKAPIKMSKDISNTICSECRIKFTFFELKKPQCELLSIKSVSMIPPSL